MLHNEGIRCHKNKCHINNITPIIPWTYMLFGIRGQLPVLAKSDHNQRRKYAFCYKSSIYSAWKGHTIKVKYSHWFNAKYLLLTTFTSRSYFLNVLHFVGLCFKCCTKTIDGPIMMPSTIIIGGTRMFPW
jgi:hypothetical protein